MEDNERTYLLINYDIGATGNLDNIRSRYPNLVFTEISPGYYTIQVPQGQDVEFERLNNELDFVVFPLAYGLNAQEALEISNISVFHNYPYGELRGTGVLVGFVDTGIAYTNSLFQNADGTSRISRIWDQTIQGDGSSAFGYGTVYTTEDINRALQSAEPYSVVPSRDENGHGTYLAGITAGNDQSDAASYIGGAPDASIMMVKLRPANQSVRNFYLIEDDEPVYQSNDILTGIEFLIREAYSMNMPLVICLGLGNNFGAHNGSDILERYLERISAIDNVIVVTAAGNEGNSAHHYRGNITTGGTDNVEINVGNNERGFLLFLWAALPNRIQIALRTPLGETVDRVPIINNQDQRYSFNLEQSRVTVRYLYPEPFTGTEAIVVRIEDPTPGIWTIIVSGEFIVSGEYHIWLSRTNFISEETRFLNPDPNVTVQIPGTGSYSLVVGAYNDQDDSVYVASGRGPTTFNVIKPDIIAPGVNVLGPTPGGGFTSYTGTSAAAAVTASACALLLQWATIEGKYPYMNTPIARGILTRGARRQREVTYPNNIEGYGRLDLQNSLNTL